MCAVYITVVDNNKHQSGLRPLQQYLQLHVDTKKNQVERQRNAGVKTLWAPSSSSSSSLNFFLLYSFKYLVTLFSSSQLLKHFPTYHILCFFILHSLSITHQVFYVTLLLSASTTQFFFFFSFIFLFT